MEKEIPLQNWKISSWWCDMLQMSRSETGITSGAGSSSPSEDGGECSVSERDDMSGRLVPLFHLRIKLLAKNKCICVYTVI